MRLRLMQKEKSNIMDHQRKTIHIQILIITKLISDTTTNPTIQASFTLSQLEMTIVNRNDGELR